MRVTYDCIPCLLKQCTHVMRVAGTGDETTKEALRAVLAYFADADLDEMPPTLSRGAWAIIAEHAGTDDPYAAIKARFDRELLDYEPLIRKRMLEAEAPALAVKLAILGNLVDLGANQRIQKGDVLEAMAKIAEKPLAIDDHAALFADLAQAETLLYLGDNCGEIVFDKAFIDYLSHRFPELGVTYAVRGSPVLNDVTRVDAEIVGMAEVAEVVDNGDGAPGTVLCAVSPSFRDRFESADVVIGKGQGNFESLSAVDRERVYLLFMAKCEVISQVVGVPPRSLICMAANRHQIRWD